MSPSLGEALEAGVLLFDGALGTALLPHVERDGQGLPKRPLEELNLEHPELVLGVHRRYVEAGSDVLTTNTFQASPQTLRRVDAKLDAEGICREGVRLALRALRGPGDQAPRTPGFVVGSIGPGWEVPSRTGRGVDSLREGYRDQARWLLEEGVHALLIETCRDPLVLGAALDACLDVRGDGKAEILVSLALDSAGRFLDGIDPAPSIARLAEEGIRNWGLNCMAPVDLERVIPGLSSREWGPRLASPNAGLPRLEGTESIHPVGPVAFADVQLRLRRTLDLRGLGGCCGTDARHLRELRSRLDLDPVR